MNNNFLGIRGLYKTHMDELKPFNSKSVTYTYIGYTEHNSRGQPIVCRLEHHAIMQIRNNKTHVYRVYHTGSKTSTYFTKIMHWQNNFGHIPTYF